MKLPNAYINDCLKKLIIVNANQKAPAELERILPDILLDATVIGLIYSKYDKVPNAFAIRRYGSKTSAENLKNWSQNKQSDTNS